MDDSSVQSIFIEFTSIQDAIGNSRPSDMADHDRQYRKIALLSCASYLEHAFYSEVRSYFSTRGTASGEFVRQHAIERKFHTWFNFDQPLPDKFFKAFGSEVEAHYKGTLRSDADFDASARSFMRIVASRNQLVHGNLAEQVSDLTFDEVRVAYREARNFPCWAFDIVESCDRPLI